MDLALQQKFKIKPNACVNLVNAPINLVFEQSGGEENIVIVFVHTSQEVKRFAATYALNAVGKKIILWCAYPKKSAGLKTDLSRDVGWEALTKVGLEIVSIISVDETWSAVRFKKKSANSSRLNDGEPRSFSIPEPLQLLLNQNKKATSFIESLSYTNQKEYALWISAAKRPTTLQKRLSEALDKLLAKKKNPTEK
jgi:hypothetical protein